MNPAGEIREGRKHAETPGFDVSETRKFGRLVSQSFRRLPLLLPYNPVIPRTPHQNNIRVHTSRALCSEEGITSFKLALLIRRNLFARVQLRHLSSASEVVQQRSLRSAFRTRMIDYKPSGELDELLDSAWDRGICSDEVVYSRATSSIATDGEIPFEARYLPCLDKKPTSRSPSPEQESDDEESSQTPQCAAMQTNGRSYSVVSTSSVDPFAAPRDNVVKEMDDYTCVLNKYALEEGHFLVVTNDFYPQKGLLRASDLAMMRDMLAQSNKRRYCFFNGGLLAGASQEHRHFQFLQLPDFENELSWPDQIYHGNPESLKIQQHPQIPAHHFLLSITDTSTASLDSSFKRLHRAAQIAVGTDDEEMPYNFMMTREYMLVFPRRNEEWDEHEVGVGGTCLVGSIMVTKPRDLEIVKAVGVKRILEYVGFPRKDIQ